MWHNYLKRKEEVMDHYDAVKTAQSVDIEEIPLPSLPESNDSKAGDIPLPPLLAPKVGILKKSSVLDSLRPKTCPGVPAGPPPVLKDYIEAESVLEEPRSKKIRFANEEEAAVTTTAADDEPKDSPKVDNLQKKMLAMSGQDVDAYMKEMKEVYKKTEAEKAADLRSRMARLESEQPQPPGEFPMIPNPGYMLRPPLRPTMPGMAPPQVRLPPGPPPIGQRPQLPPGKQILIKKTLHFNTVKCRKSA